jgi:hypothetical protein
MGDQLELSFGPLRMTAIHRRRPSLTLLGDLGNDVLVSCMNLIRWTWLVVTTFHLDRVSNTVTVATIAPRLWRASFPCDYFDPKLLGVMKGAVGEYDFASSYTNRILSHKSIDLSVVSSFALLTFSRSLQQYFSRIISINTTMRTQSSLLALFALIAPFASADLHSDGVCVDVVGGQNVYNGVATTAACTAYLHRNTGGEQWDTCPDCTMVSA